MAPIWRLSLVERAERELSTILECIQALRWLRNVLSEEVEDTELVRLSIKLNRRAEQAAVVADYFITDDYDFELDKVLKDE